MPELPEVETIRRDLERQVVGRWTDSVLVSGSRSVRRHPDAAAFAAGVQGRQVLAVQRRGKYLLCHLGGDHALVVHLGMSGQLLWAAGGGEPAPRHTHVVVAFRGGGELRFVDPRTFGQLFLTTAGGPGGTVPELAHLGLDPIADGMDAAAFARRLGSRRARLKPLLMDQRFLAGIGNLYADEILFGAGVRGDRSSETLSAQEARRLYRAMMEILTLAIEGRGSSLADEQYRDLYGRTGRYQAHHQVYGREGGPCRRCRGRIVRVQTGGRSSFFCPGCQR